MTKVAHRYKQKTVSKAKAQKRFLEGLLKAHEHFSFQKVSGKCKKALRHQTCGE